MQGSESTSTHPYRTTIVGARPFFFPVALTGLYTVVARDARRDESSTGRLVDMRTAR